MARHRPMKVLRSLVLVGALAAFAVGCGDDGDDAAADEETTTTEEETTTTMDPAAEEEAVTTVVTDFFAAYGRSEFDTVASLLENGESHRAEFVHCENVSQGVSAEVTSVDFADESTADVMYTLLINDTPVLEGAGGQAVKTDGEWKVAESTYLSLYDAAKDGCTGPPPPDA